MKFYKLGSKNLNSWIDSISYDSIKKECDECGTYLINYSDNAEVIVIGKKLVDFYGNFLFSIVSEEFKNIVEKSGLTGVRFYELDVKGFYDSKRNEMNHSQRLFKMNIIGKSGMARDEYGEVLEHCEKCKVITPVIGPSNIGYIVIESEWDRSNIFYFENLRNGVIVIDEKAYNVFKKAKLKNIEMKPLEKCWK